MELMCTRNKFMHSARSVQVGREMQTSASDVFIVTYPKCGTTWMTQIAHSLRTNGQLDYGEITEVVPWDILGHDCGQDLNAPQVAMPRLFKSHETFQDVAKGARYIYVARNPLDAFVSFHKFLPAYAGLRPDDISMETFADAIFAGASQSGQIWNHFLSFYERKDDPNVLIMFFEDMKEDLEACVQIVAEWLDLPGGTTPELVQTALSQSTHQFMSSLEHKHHFDDHFVRNCVSEQMGLDPNRTQGVTKVRQEGGKVGEGGGIPEKVKHKLKQHWADILAGPTGCATYAEFRTSLSRLQR